MRPSKPIVGVGMWAYTRFALGFACLTLPPPLLFLLSLSSPIAFSPRLQTRMSRNSSLESQAFVKRASTGNRLLSIQNDIPIKSPDLLDHLKWLDSCNPQSCKLLTHIFKSPFFPCSLFSVIENINRNYETESFIYFAIIYACEIWSLKPIPYGTLAPRGTSICAAEQDMLDTDVSPVVWRLCPQALSLRIRLIKQILSTG